MSNHLTELRNYMDIAGVTPLQESVPATSPTEIVVQVVSDQDSIMESLDLLRFKLLNHRQMTGSDDYALGYEEACLKVVEMIDGIIHNHKY